VCRVHSEPRYSLPVHVRVLHLTPELPYWPGGSGGSTRQFHLLRRLIELGHEVAVVAPATVVQQPRIVDLRAVGMEVAIHERPPSRVRETLRALRHEPDLAPALASLPILAWQVAVFWHFLRPAATELVRDWRPDVVTVEHDQAAGWVADLDPLPPAVLIFQNVGWAYYESRARAVGGFGALALRLESRRFRRYDERNLAQYRRLIAVSDRDAAELYGTGPPIDIVPNGVATEAIEPLSPADGAPTLLFTGTMAYPPNAEGIVWFARDVWPLVRSKVPEAQLLVVGRDPPRQVQALTRDPAIEVSGWVPDMAPYFARSTAAVVPLRSGGGTRLKVLEAMASGRTVISTTVGAEGIDAEPGTQILLADEPHAFADTTVRVLRNPGLRDDIAARGRRLVEERYDWGALGDRFADALAMARDGA
jgi:glycosyltransferase involved in cell wall biosynthesis